MPRRFSDAQVANLLLMAEDTGITTPIHVRKVAGKHVLIDGAHRLEAARRLGYTDIAALVHDCRADEARAMEASNNLGADVALADGGLCRVKETRLLRDASRAQAGGVQGQSAHRKARVETHSGPPEHDGGDFDS